MSLIGCIAAPCSGGSTSSQVISVLPDGTPHSRPRNHAHLSQKEKDARDQLQIKNLNAAGGIMIDDILECPLANISIPGTSVKICPYHAHKRANFFHMRTNPTVDMVPDPKGNICDNETTPNDSTAALLKNIGGGDRIREICTRFYARAFVDKLLKPFFFNFDGATKHAVRLGDWIVEHMGGEGRKCSLSL
jgi:hypothetical protein